MTPKFHEDSDIYCLACATAPLYADFTEQMLRRRTPLPYRPSFFPLPAKHRTSWASIGFFRPGIAGNTDFVDTEIEIHDGVRWFFVGSRMFVQAMVLFRGLFIRETLGASCVCFTTLIAMLDIYGISVSFGLHVYPTLVGCSWSLVLGKLECYW